MRQIAAVVLSGGALLNLLLFASAPNTALAINVRTVALRFQQAPGTTGGTEYFNSISSTTVSLNDSGKVAFLGLLATGAQGLWSEGSGSLALVAKQNDPAAGTPAGTTYASFSSPILNDVGQIAFRSSLGSTFNEGIWSGVAGNLGLVARSGQPAPGAAGATFSNFPGGTQFAYVFNNLGQTAFFGATTGTFNSPAGIWLGVPGNVNLVALKNTQANGIAAGMNFQTISPPTLNNAGQVAFHALYSGSTIPPGTGIWTGNASSLNPVAYSGVAAPDSGGNYSNFTSYVTLNDVGDTLFHATVNSTNGLWSGHAGNLSALALKGMAAPGTPAGVAFDGFVVPGFLNNSGDAAFLAVLAGTGVDSTNDRGMWLRKSGNLSLVTREGDHAPGTNNGVVFDSISGPSINDAGQLVFQADLIGTGVDATNNRGIWATDAAGQLQLILRSGDLLQVAPSDVRTISSLSFTGYSASSDGRPSALNNLGQIAFTAAFTNNTSGLFVTGPVAVPEPSSFAMVAIAMVGILASAKHRS